jgi:hypothetical protein
MYEDRQNQMVEIVFKDGTSMEPYIFLEYKDGVYYFDSARGVKFTVPEENLNYLIFKPNATFTFV